MLTSRVEIFCDVLLVDQYSRERDSTTVTLNYDVRALIHQRERIFFLHKNGSD